MYLPRLFRCTLLVLFALHCSTAALRASELRASYRKTVPWASCPQAALVGSDAEWRFDTGSAVARDWRELSFDDTDWPTGRAGFGYGTEGNRTPLGDMRGRYTRVRLRATFDLADPGSLALLALYVRYDDGFIATLNGHEVARAAVEGDGRNPRRVHDHEAGAFEVFRLDDYRDRLRPGRNVLAVEGFNRSLDSSDFTVHPVLIGVDRVQRDLVAAARAESSAADGERRVVHLPPSAQSHRWTTQFPSSFRADALRLTPAGDPRHEIHVSWRTSVQPGNGFVRYWPAEGGEPSTAEIAQARTMRVETPSIVNDPVVLQHEAKLSSLKPGTRYAYQVGVQDGAVSVVREFTTAAEACSNVRMIYLGDAQNGLDRWGTLARQVNRRFPAARFWLITGDLVNEGMKRAEWDHFFTEAGDILHEKPLLPVIGNHEYYPTPRGGPKFPAQYVQWFALPRNGPASLEPERAYHWRWGLVHVFVLDTEAAIAPQAAWLDTQLGASDAPWKIIAFHHPAHSSKPDRNNADVRAAVAPVADRHGVRLVLQGHDHAYLRTKPLIGERIAPSPEKGTTYVVAFSGTKMYTQTTQKTTAVGMTGVRTYQVIDFTPSELHYRAFNLHHALVDELRISAPEEQEASKPKNAR